MTARNLSLLLGLALAVGACMAPEAGDKSVVLDPDQVVCLEENPKVRGSAFILSLIEALQQKNVDLKLLEKHGAENCPTHLTYTANYQVTSQSYLVYSLMEVTRDGQEVGRAVYDARRDSSDEVIFGSDEVKVQGLVDRLLP